MDNDSIDQKLLTEEVCKGIDVEYVNYGYSQILQRVVQGDIDGLSGIKMKLMKSYAKLNIIQLRKSVHQPMKRFWSYQKISQNWQLC